MKQKLIIFISFLFTAHLSVGAIFTVAFNTDAGAGSLRDAITQANMTPTVDVIEFTGPMTITLTSALPAITQPLFIDGPVVSGQPQIEINATGVTGIGFNVAAAGTTIKGLNIHGHSGQEILVTQSNFTVTGCYIGTNFAGTAGLGGGGTGIEVAAGLSNILIGGSTADSSNIISGNGAGIIIAPNSTNVRIAGNRIGIGSTGAPLANSASGIIVINATNLTIGGSIQGEGNIVANNMGNGIELNGCTDGKIQGNNIGISSDNVSALPNLGHGILLNSCSDFLIGGSYLAKNVISGNAAAGINIRNNSNITVQYNYIGTDRKGVLDKGNASHGIQLEETNTGIIIGGSRYVHGNIVSCNNGSGISFEAPGAGNGLAPSHGTIIKGNLIGTDSTATVDFGNNVIGLTLKSNDCIIGGTANDEGNVIAGTDILCGLLVANANRNVIKGNFIGVGLDGTTPIANKLDGIMVAVENIGQTANNNIIQYNTIAYNLQHGVSVGRTFGGTPTVQERNNSIRFNKIYCNAGQGIFLNRTVPADMGNNGNPAPAINTVTSTTSVINGTANAAHAGHRIDLYEMIDCQSCDVNPQGKIWIDSTVANASGGWSYDYFAAKGTTLSPTTRVVATATDLAGNTSQFSLCCLATSGNKITPKPGTTICTSTIFSIEYTDDQGKLAGDSVMLQSSPDGISWTNIQAKILTPTMNFTNLSITDTTQFRFITFSGGAFPGGCSDTSSPVPMNAVSPPIAGNTNITPSTICPGDAFTVSLTGSYGFIQWQKSVAGGAFTNTAETNLTFTETPAANESPVQYRAIASRPACPAATSDTATGTIISISAGTITGPQQHCDLASLDLTLSGFNGNVQWQNSTAGDVWTNIPLATGSGITFIPSGIVATDFVRVIVTDPTGTCPQEISNIYTVVSDTCSDPLPIRIPNAMTPNNDGSNDVFFIENIGFYPNNHLLIFNRWGNKVYEANGYLNEWDGKDLPDATYYYLLELGADINGNENEKNKYEGNVTILK